MDHDQLEAFALRLKAETDREREERNFFQMERDKIRTFWEISRGQFEEAVTALRQKDHEVEMAQEIADIEAKKITQQMRYLQFENHNKLSEIRAEAMTQLKMAQEDYVQLEMEILADKRELKRLLRESEETHEIQIQQLKIKHIEEIHDLCSRFEKETKDLIFSQEEKNAALKPEIELNYRMQMFEFEERKNAQIQKLIENHDLAFSEMKNYYDDITLNNMGLISYLKEQIEILRKQCERSDRIAMEMSAENHKLSEPLEQAQNELVTLRRKLEFHERDRAQLSRLKARNNYVESQLRALTWETETLLLQNKTLVKEKEELKEKFEVSVVELQQKNGLKNVLLERKIAIIEKDGEKRDMVLQETIKAYQAAMNTIGQEGDPPIQLEKRATSVLEEKNKIIQDLRYEVVRVKKAHDALLDIYGSKLVQLGIPREELGFEPLNFASGHASFAKNNL